MADSVRELIMKNLQTTLEGVTVANGYANSLLSVQRFLQPGQTVTETPVVLLLEGEDDVSLEGPLAGAGSLVSRTLNVGLLIIDRQQTDTDQRSASERMNSLVADIQKALQVDYQRGGHAIDTNEVSVSPLDVEEGQPELSLTMVYAIKYRHRRNDPTLET
jgi:hypothetical protein